MILAGLTFSFMNAMVRETTLQLDHFQAQFMRWSFSALVFVPLMLRHIAGQFVRGAVHTMGVTLWFTAVGHYFMTRSFVATDLSATQAV
ncbi:MAG: hypothetical protein Q8N17_23520, partial [Burkholderiaceae bacterium]|nr:hypothetical protein [Burkholderiaceae bacterium]